MSSDYSPIRQDFRSSLQLREPELRRLLQARLADFSHVFRLAVFSRRNWLVEVDRGNPNVDAYGRWVESMRVEMRAMPLRTIEVERFPQPEFEQNLRSMIGIARSNGIEPVLLTQPAIWGAEPGDWEERLWGTRTAEYRFSHQQAWELLERFNDVTRSLAAESRVPLIDLAREVPKSPDLFYDDSHFTIRGAEVVAEIAARSLLPIVCEHCPGAKSSTSPDYSRLR